MGQAVPQWSSALASDALDEVGLRDRVLSPGLLPLGPGTVLSGPVLTVLVETTTSVRDPDDPYRSEIDAVAQLRPGHVPLYSAPEGNRAALWGELFSRAALAKGALGAVVDGYVRDCRRVRAAGFPVFARGASPLDTRARARVCAVGDELEVCGVTVASGDFVVADDDGVVVVPSAALTDVARLVGQRHRNEDSARIDLGAGSSLDAVWKKWRAL
jgi:4-hydroxy-4-methyl-2-oxoglutarate aldolase